ncbi:MAG: glycosyltransferase family 2 protein [Elusimicrobia bacterium]|nr:glycosyltransferase family 2 protein [Elusimicrobiota bacterium]
MKDISVVVPVYNEVKVLGEFLPGIIGVLRDMNIEYELIIVDDGSKDGSPGEIEKFLPDIKIIRHETNRGYGAAIKTGIRCSKYDRILILDADGSYLPQDTVRLLEHADDFEMVVGARIDENIGRKLLRGPAKWFLKKLAEYISGEKIPDLNSGMRIFDKKISAKYMGILPNGFSFTSTITLIMLCNDYKVKYVPIEYRKRVGKSKINPVRSTVGFFSLIIRTSVYFNAMKVYGPVSAALMVSGIGLGLYKAITVRNITTMTVIVLLAGLQIGMIGLLADLINRKMR